MNVEGDIFYEYEQKPSDSDDEDSLPYDGGNVCAKCHHPLKTSFQTAQKVKSKGKTVTKHDKLVLLCFHIFILSLGRDVRNAMMLTRVF
jgi:hypothetical protein